MELRELELPVATDTLPLIPVEPVVVRVLRSPVTMDRAPFALSVLGESQTSRGRTGASLEEALHGLPGVQVQARFNDAVGERLSVRGFGARSQFGVRGVRVVVDGIPATLPDGQSTLDHVDLGSLGRVEVLRGPGSALYGNAAGGVVDLETRRPPPSPIRQEVRAVRGSHGLVRIQSTTSGTAAGTGYLLNVARYEREGFRSNPLAEEGSLYGAGARDHVNTQVHREVGDGLLRLTANYVDLSAENPGSLPREDLDAEETRAYPFNVVQGTGKEMTQGQLGLTWTGPAGPGQLEASIHGTRRDLENPIPSDVIVVDRYAGGGRLVLRGDRGIEPGEMSWAVGVEADIQRDDRKNFGNEEGSRTDRTLDQLERVLGGAVFLQAFLPIVPDLDVMTGLRYDRILFRARDRMAGLPGSDGEPLPDASGSRTLDSSSPSLGIQFGPTPAFGIYANMATAFETPTTTELVNRPEGEGGLNQDLDAQVGVTTELGARGTLGTTATYELVFFHTSLRNELVPFEVPDSPGRTFYRNAGASRRNGAELSLRVAPAPSLHAQLTYSLVDARFRHFSVGEEDYAGNRIPGLAPQRGEALVRLDPGGWFAELRTEWVDAVPGDDANTAEARAPSYWLADLRAGVEEVRVGRITLNPFVGVTNLFDRFYASSVTVNAFGGRYFEPGPGRSAYMGLGLAWER